MAELASFLGAHSPFQSMDRAEREALAAGSSSQDFVAGEIVADYSTQVPEDIWMVCTGHVVLQASIDGATIDSVEPGGIFGYMPMLTGGGMEFIARATEASSLIRLPGPLVRAQFAKPSGLAFLASSAWNTARDNRILLVPAPEGRPVGELVGGDALIVAPETSVRDAVVAMTQQRVSYALIRTADGQLGIFTDRDLRTRVVAASSETGAVAIR
jgi:CBS domain-containing protein